MHPNIPAHMHVLPADQLPLELISSTNAVAAELQRSDAKAAGVGAAAIGGITMATALCSALPQLDQLTKVAVLSAVSVFLGSLALALAAVRPHLRRGNQLAISFIDFAGLTPEQLIESASSRHQAALTTAHAERLVTLSQLALHKYRLLRGAVDLLSCGLALITLAAVLALEAH
ncbi:Pycsar system effector family protein [Kitasatospora indigofera]|uniref:Pycsar system effector family protein n=1 Tax=Kitasatospora indigofera TaxID=67307 RepID=UPI0036CF56F3